MGISKDYVLFKLYWDNVLSLGRNMAPRKNKTWDWVISVRYLKKVFFKSEQDILLWLI